MMPAKTKRAAPDRATRGTTTHTPNDSATHGDAQRAFVILCTRSDGRRAHFQRYPTRREAELVAARLRSVGCPCDIEAAL